MKKNHFLSVLLLGSILLTATLNSNASLAQATSGGLAYVVNNASNDVSVISLSTNTVITTIPVGVTPYRVVFTPDGSKAYVTNIGDDTVSVIDTSTHTVIAVVPVGVQPQILDVSPDGARVYVANYVSQTISIIDTATDTVIGSFAASFPVGITFSPDGSEVWVGTGGGQNRIQIFSYPGNTLVGSVTGVIGEGQRIEFLPDGSFAYVSNGCGCCGNIQKISTTSYSVVWMHYFSGGGSGLAIASDGSVVYAGTEGHCGGGGPQVKMINPFFDSIIGSLPVSSGPAGIAITPDGSFLYVTAAAQGEVLVVDTSDQTVIATIPVGISPSDVVIAPLVVDTTPPEITPIVSGSLGNDGWYVSDVTVNWTVTDPESGIASSTGCDPTTLTTDTAGVTLTCSATNGAGLSDSVSVTIKLDKTAPTLSITTPEPYAVEPVGTALDFSASDALSGLEAEPLATLTGEAVTLEMASGEQPGVGIYEVVVEATDQAGNSVASEPRLLVIYDPDGGFVTGGGWIYSTPGDYIPDPTLEGTASFGFVSKYKKGATEPTGQTEFQFHVADLNFHSSSYDWLVITGGDYAKFKGVGAINGIGDYKFMIWAGDGEPDTFRIKIWEEDEYGNEVVLYDNGADQEIGGGSVVIHTNNQ